MASVTAAISTLKKNSQFGASLNGASAVPKWLRRLLVLYLFPNLLRAINGALSGERLGTLSVEQASELYLPLQKFHQEIAKFIDRIESAPWWERKLLSHWHRRVAIEYETLDDILESLEWGSSPELRSYLDCTISEIEAEHRVG